MTKIRVQLKQLLITCAVCLGFLATKAQQKPYSIVVVSNTDTLEQLQGKTDRLKLNKKIDAIVNKRRSKGYILANSTLETNAAGWTATVTTGAKYIWGRFNVKQIPEVLLSKAGYNENQFINKTVKTEQLGKMLTKIIEISDNTGYPFAQVSLDSVVVKNQIIHASVVYIPGPLITNGKLVQTSNEFIKSNYLEAYLGIKEGLVFKGKAFEEIPQKIERLPYVKLSNTPKIKFYLKQSWVTLTLKPIKSNTVDALIGLAPNQTVGTNSSGLLVTGYVNMQLQNLFKTGKQFTFKWKQFNAQSQSLFIQYNHTNLLRSPINIMGSFSLLKQDTTFINRKAHLLIGYITSFFDVGFSGHFKSSRLLSSPKIIPGEPLEFLDFNTQYFAISLKGANLDHPLNPRHGWAIEGQVAIGGKQLLPTNLVPVQVYDTLTTRFTQGQAQVSATYVQPINKLWVAYSKLEVAGIKANGALFLNDLYRIGGINSIRGFNELQIYSSSYVLFQLESRILLTENSRIFVLADWAHTSNVVQQTNANLLGLGGGVVLATPSGIFQLVYAVGNSLNQSFSLKESKIHFGYVAKF